MVKKAKPEKAAAEKKNKTEAKRRQNAGKTQMDTKNNNACLNNGMFDA